GRPVHARGKPAGHHRRPGRRVPTHRRGPGPRDHRAALAAGGAGRPVDRERRCWCPRRDRACHATAGGAVRADGRALPGAWFAQTAHGAARFDPRGGPGASARLLRPRRGPRARLRPGVLHRAAVHARDRPDQHGGRGGAAGRRDRLAGFQDDDRLQRRRPDRSGNGRGADGALDSDRPHRPCTGERSEPARTRPGRDAIRADPAHAAAAAGKRPLQRHRRGRAVRLCAGWTGLRGPLDRLSQRHCGRTVAMTAAARFKVREVELYERPVVLRLPFRFGVVTLTHSPQAFVRARIEFPDGASAWGAAAEMMAPKWFDKNLQLTNEDNFDQLRGVLLMAREAYLSDGHSASAFGHFARHYDSHLAAAQAKGYNPLLANYGPALLDRAVLDALCRHRGVSFYDAMQSNLPGIGGDQPEFADFDFARFLKRLQPEADIEARHTVGMLDAITAADLKQRVNDGLPETLEEVVQAYGHRFFKLKVGGNVASDVPRLEE